MNFYNGCFLLIHFYNEFIHIVNKIVLILIIIFIFFRFQIVIHELSVIEKLLGRFNLLFGCSQLFFIEQLNFLLINSEVLSSFEISDQVQDREVVHFPVLSFCAPSETFELLI